MAFQNWLIMFPKTGETFPHDLIEKNTYKSTPLQRTEIKAYRDSNNLLHRVTSPNYKTKIEFQTPSGLDLSQMSRIRRCLNLAMDNSQQRRLTVRYWDDELLDYRTSDFYIPDLTYEIIKIDTKNSTIKYAPLKLTFIEY